MIIKETVNEFERIFYALLIEKNEKMIDNMILGSKEKV